MKNCIELKRNKNHNVEKNPIDQAEISHANALDKNKALTEFLPEASLSADPLPIQFKSSEAVSLHEMLELSNLLGDNTEPEKFEIIRDVDESSQAWEPTTEHLVEEIFDINDNLSPKDFWLEDLGLDNLNEEIDSIEESPISLLSEGLENDEDLPFISTFDLPSVPQDKKVKTSRKMSQSSSRTLFQLCEKPIPNESIKKDDVLFGRGKRTTYHPGNIYFRDIVSRMASQYKKCCKVQKTALSNRIVDAIHEKGGRFLTPHKESGFWVGVTGLCLRRKTSQALRDSIIYRRKHKK